MTLEVWILPLRIVGGCLLALGGIFAGAALGLLIKNYDAFRRRKEPPKRRTVMVITPQTERIESMFSEPPKRSKHWIIKECDI